MTEKTVILAVTVSGTDPASATIVVQPPKGAMRVWTPAADVRAKLVELVLDPTVPTGEARPGGTISDVLVRLGHEAAETLRDERAARARGEIDDDDDDEDDDFEERRRRHAQRGGRG